MDYSPWACKSRTQLKDFHFTFFSHFDKGAHLNLKVSVAVDSDDINCILCIT